MSDLDLVNRVSLKKNVPSNQIILLGDNSLVLTKSDSANILFGPIGETYYKYYNDIYIQPIEDSFVSITLNFDGYEISFDTNELIYITQIPCEPYPSFVLNINTHPIHSKKYFYEGLIQISEGACKIKRIQQMLIDH